MPSDLEARVVKKWGTDFGGEIIKRYPTYFAGYNISVCKFMSNCEFVADQISLTEQRSEQC